LFGGTDYRLKSKGQDFADLLAKEEKTTGQMNNEDDMEDEKVMPPIRPDIHLLMVGEPGLGKSQMLKHIINVAPRGVYVCGNSTTNAGLTATIVRDQFTNE
jgi:predicted ATP-dependent serine protease